MFMAILATIMIPAEMLIVPWYVGIARLGWIDSYAGILMPGMLTAFGVFVMRQFMGNIPDELLDAGRIDGVSEFGLFWRICLPLARPALAVVVIFTFLGNWNDFLWPLIVVNSDQMQTLQVGLSRMSSLETGADWGGTMSGAALASIPMLIVFMFFQRQIVEGMTLTGLKG
jgi:multiple sugar transport system permease protein